MSLAAVERYFGAIPPNPDIPALGDLSVPPTLGGERREIVFDKVPLPRVHVGFRAPVFGDPRLDALDLAGQILSGGKGSRLNRRLVRDERIAQDVAIFTLGFIGGASVTAGWATVRPGVPVARVEAALHEELERLATELVSDDELARAKALTESDELGALQRVEERADRLSMYATLFDDPGLDQPDAAALPGGHAGGDPGRRRGRLPAGQPGRPDLPARGHHRPTTWRVPDDEADRARRTKRWRHEHDTRSAAATVRSSPSGPSPARRAPTSSRPSPGDRWRTGCQSWSSTCPDGRSSRRRSS